MLLSLNSPMKGQSSQLLGLKYLQLFCHLLAAGGERARGMQAHSFLLVVGPQVAQFMFRTHQHGYIYHKRDQVKVVLCQATLCPSKLRNPTVKKKKK